jgi:Skp family chaperone for outer membrane proteins
MTVPDVTMFKRHLSSPTTIALIAMAMGLLAYQSWAVRTLFLPPAVVVTIDLESVFNGLDHRAALDADIKKRNEDIQIEADRQMEKIELMQADLDDYPKGSERHEALLREYRLAALDYQAYLEFSRRQLGTMEGESIRSVYDLIREQVAVMAGDQGWDLVLINDAAVDMSGENQNILQEIGARRVIYANTNRDVTDDVIEMMNTTFKSGGG